MMKQNDVEQKKSILERKAYPAFEIIIEIHHSNIWTVHEDVAMATDLLLRTDSLIHQTRQFRLDEKIQIRCEQVFPSQNEFVNDRYLTDKTQSTITKCWTQFNNLQTNQLLNKLKKNLVIYSYSISNNFLKEVFAKVDIKLTLTNNLRKASLIIGLTKHLKQNSSLCQFAQEKKIPIYSFHQISIYQLKKFIKIIT